MTSRCDAPISEDELLEYWTRAIDETEAERIEQHLFSCADCAARLETFVSIGAGLRTLVKQGRVASVISRSLLNRMQRDGVHVRMYSLFPGERVPCAAFPDDDLLVLSLRGEFAGAETVTVSLLGHGDEILAEASDVPVAPRDVEILWATPGDTIRQMPSTRVRLRVTSQAPDQVLAEYELDHTAIPPA